MKIANDATDDMTHAMMYVDWLNSPLFPSPMVRREERRL